jgi:hypothetical protein
VTINKKKCFIALKQKMVDLNYWDFGKGAAKGTKNEIKELNAYLEEVCLKLGNCYKQLQLKGKLINTKSIKSLFLGEKEEAFTLSSLISYHNETATSDLKWSILKHNYFTQRYLKNFIEEHYKATDIYLRELNYKFVKDFEVFLRNHKPKDHQKPINNNGVMKHIIRLKKMTNLALNLHWI